MRVNQRNQNTLPSLSWKEHLFFQGLWIYILLSLFSPVTLGANRAILLLLLRFSHSRLCEALNATIEAFLLLLMFYSRLLVLLAPPLEYAVHACLLVFALLAKDKFVLAMRRREKWAAKILCVENDIVWRLAPPDVSSKSDNTSSKCKQAGVSSSGNNRHPLGDILLFIQNSQEKPSVDFQ